MDYLGYNARSQATAIQHEMNRETTFVVTHNSREVDSRTLTGGVEVGYANAYTNSFSVNVSPGDTISISQNGSDWSGVDMSISVADSASAELALAGSSQDSAGLSVLFNEITSAAADSFFVEVVNVSGRTLEVGGYVLRDDRGRSFVFPATSVAADGLLTVNAGQLGFQPAAGDKLFLYNSTQDRLLDARVVTNRLRGRSSEHDGRWLYPQTATPGANNDFGFQDDVVINEIMYHPYGEASDGVNDLPDTTTPVTTTLVPAGAQAAVRVPADNSVGDHWRSATFNDSSWMTGSTGIGFDVGGVADVVAYGNLPGANGTSTFSGLAMGHDFVVNSNCIS